MSIQTFNVSSNTMAISDPCCDREDAFILKNVKNGEWETHIAKGEAFGDKVPVKFAVFHTGFLEAGALGVFVPARKRIGVDTAQIIIMDGDKYPEKVGDYEDDESFFAKACAACDMEAVLDGSGFVCSTASRDGSFSLKKIVVDHQVVGLALNFLE